MSKEVFLPELIRDEEKDFPKIEFPTPYEQGTVIPQVVAFQTEDGTTLAISREKAIEWGLIGEDEVAPELITISEAIRRKNG